MEGKISIEESSTASALVEPKQQDHGSALNLVVQLVQELNAAGIRYCHWKSNYRLDADLAGKDDLDLLISIDDKSRSQEIISRLGFKLFIQVPSKRYNAIVDFVGLDATTGTLVHLHTHYRLTLGQKCLKGFRLPWEQAVLDSARPATGSVPIPLPSPEVELLLLVIRICLRVRPWEWFFRETLNRREAKLYWPERAWLAHKTDKQKLERLNAKWLGPALWPDVCILAFSDAGAREVFGARRKVVAHLSQYRTFNSWESSTRSAYRRASWAFGRVNKRYLHWPRPWGRSSTSGGLVVCVLGADGAGKTTLTRELVQWLVFKLDSIPVYMGSGDGPSSLPLRALKFVRRWIFFRAGSIGQSQSLDRKDMPHTGQSKSALLRPALVVWGIFLALEKRKKLTLAYRAASRGIIVVADRYPQAQIFGFNDGPLLQDFRSSRLAFLRAIARWELRVYRMANVLAPDLVIKLVVPVEMAMTRKRNLVKEDIERRNAAIARLSFPDCTRVITIAADLPASEVALKAKAAVWSAL